MEAILPRDVESYQDLKDLGVTLFKDINPDLGSCKRGIFDPLYDLLDAGGKRWRPVYGMILAKDLGMDIDDFEKSKLLYQCLAAGELIHNASLVIDDIEDQSLKRRGKDCAYIKYGLDISINAGCTLLNLPMWGLFRIMDTSDPLCIDLVKEINKELVCIHFGQNWDINWHNGYHFPSEDEYFQMTSSKTGVIPRLIANLVCRINKVEDEKREKISYMTDKLGIAFQIQDDVIALESDAYAETRGIIGEDIHEGKRTLMVIHSHQNLAKSDSDRLLDILKMHTEDKETIKEAIDLIKSTDSINYAKSVAENMIQR